MQKQKKRTDQSGQLGDLRTKKIMLRATEIEFKSINENAKEQRKKTAIYIRDLALKQHVNKHYKSQEDLYLTTSMLTQIQKIGVNLNQIAKHFNQKIHTSNDFKEFASLLFEFKEIVKGEKNVDENI